MEPSLPPPPPSPPLEPQAASGPSTRTWTVLCHAAALSGIVFHVVGFVAGPLIVWLMKRGESTEIDAHGKEAVNFQLSMLIWHLIAFLLCFLLVGIPILIGLFIANIVLIIIGSLRASEGTLYRYPLTIRFLK